jgi:hypothetical protein
VIVPEIDSTESEDVAAKATLDPIAFWSLSFFFFTLSR